MASIRRLALPVLIMLSMPLTALAHPLDAPKAPPSEPVYEVDPGDRLGYTRVMGHWEWTGENYMWSPGRWVAEKEGAVWVADNWTQRGKKWHLTPGHYEADGSAPSVATEASEAMPEARPDRPDTAADEVKERSEPAGSKDAAKNEEMDDVEQKVLAPSAKKPGHPNPRAATRRVKHPVVKKTVDYNDPTQFPYYQHH